MVQADLKIILIKFMLMYWGHISLIYEIFYLMIGREESSKKLVVLSNDSDLIFYGFILHVFRPLKGKYFAFFY